MRIFSRGLFSPRNTLSTSSANLCIFSEESNRSGSFPTPSRPPRSMRRVSLLVSGSFIPVARSKAARFAPPGFKVSICAFVNVPFLYACTNSSAAFPAAFSCRTILSSITGSSASSGVYPRCITYSGYASFSLVTIRCSSAVSSAPRTAFSSAAFCAADITGRP